MDTVRRRGWFLLVGVISVAIALALLVLISASSSKMIEAYPFAQLFFFALAFNALSYLARWLLTKNRRRTYLQGRVPFALGLVRLCGFVAFSILLLAFLAGLAAGPPLRELALRALIAGMILFATLSLTATGILNAIIVTRHFRGTLATSSRESYR